MKYDFTKSPYFHLVTTFEWNTEINNYIKDSYGDFLYIEIDCETCKDVNSLLNEIAKKFNFPDYFGCNWMALDECLNDLDWLEFIGCIITMKNLEKLLINQQDALKIFYGILSDTVNEWNLGRSFDGYPTQPTPFHVICTTNDIDSCKQKLNTNNIYFN